MKNLLYTPAIHYSIEGSILSEWKPAEENSSSRKYRFKAIRIHKTSIKHAPENEHPEIGWWQCVGGEKLEYRNTQILRENTERLDIWYKVDVENEINEMTHYISQSAS